MLSQWQWKVATTTAEFQTESTSLNNYQERKTVATCCIVTPIAGYSGVQSRGYDTCQNWAFNIG